LLSIITVVLNAKDALSFTIDSIRNQKGVSGFEFLVIDGGSKDGTLEVIKDNLDLITGFISEKDAGLYHAMNKGLDMATGSMILFLNAGDYFVGQVLSDSLEPKSLLSVKYQSFFGTLKRARFKESFLGMPYCHQGIVFPNTNIRYDTTFKISADYKFCIDTGVDSSWKVVASKGYIYYHNEGLSNRNYKIRDSEVEAILKKRFGTIPALLFRFKATCKNFAKVIFGLIWRK
jgi:putative colanic acid biosynthesis glycosyltransferase